jgi:predicted MFS family arabinose efflux permease
MGLIGAAFGLGFVLGPALGGFLSAISLAAPGYAAAALASANGVAAFFILPEPKARVASPRRAHVAALLDELRRPGIRRLIVIYLLAVLAFSGMEATFALIAAHRCGLDQRHVSYVFAFIGVVVTVVQGGLIGPLTRRFGEQALLVAGFILQAVGLAAVPYAGNMAGLLGACLPLAFGSGLSTPALSSLLSRSARDEDQGGTLGIGQSAAALGRIGGPISATNAYDHVWYAAPYVGGAVIMLVTAAIGSTLRRPHEKALPETAPRPAREA